MQRSIEALVDDGLDDSEAEHCASQFNGRLGSTWDLLHMSDTAH